MNRRFALTALLLLLAHCCISQKRTIKYLGIENGLSNNEVTSIYQDEKGFMWFGTYDGLNKYDGYSFTTYRHLIDDSASLCDNRINCIITGPAHNLLIGTHNGLSVYNAATQTFSTAAYTGGNGNKRITGFVNAMKACGPDILVGTAHSVILLKDNEGRELRLDAAGTSKSDYDTRAITWDTTRKLAWMLIQNQGLGLYDGKTNIIRIVNADIKTGNALQMDGNGNLWIGSNNGLCYYDTKANRFTGLSYLEHTKVVALCLDRLNALWIATDGGGLFNLKTGTLTKEDGIGSNAIYAVFDDREGRKWIGTLRGGINIIEKVSSPFGEIVTAPQQGAGDIKNFILSFGETPDHNVWIGTDGSGLRYWDRAANRFTEYNASPEAKTALSSNFITNIATDFEGRTWFSTWFGGIDRFDGTAHRFEHFTCYNPRTRQEEKNVWLVYEDTHKTLWASTVNKIGRAHV